MARKKRATKGKSGGKRISMVARKAKSSRMKPKARGSSRRFRYAKGK